MKKFTIAATKKNIPKKKDRINFPIPSNKFINIIYEDIFIREYNSIKEGYNIEKTLDKVLNGEKQITNNINKVNNF